MNRLAKEINKEFYIPKANVTIAMSKRLPSLAPLHSACEIALNCSHDYFMANVAYNHYVVNGTRRPENLGEEIQMRISAMTMSEDIKRAYLKACWVNGQFQYPARELVSVMMFR